MVTVLGVYGPRANVTDHEGSATIIRDGEILAAIEEDRITRVKHDGQPLMWNAVMEAMRISGVAPEEIDAVAIPWEGIWDHYIRDLEMNPFSLFRYPMDVCMTRSFDKRLKDMLADFGIYAPLNYVHHHTSHAASALLTSGSQDCNILTLDGSGDGYESISVWTARDDTMKQLSLVSDTTFGNFYSYATYAIGFKIDDGEGKTMGLASYGDPSSVYDKIANLLKVDGLSVDPMRATFTRSITPGDDRPFALYRYLKAETGNPFLDLVKTHRKEDVAAAAQKLLEDRVTQLVRNVIAKTNNRKICLSGGVALNVKLNQKIREMPEVEDVFVFPNPGDPGVAVGAALFVCKKLMEQLGREFRNERLRHTYFGTAYSDEQVIRALQEYRLEYQKVGDPEKAAADLIAEGKVVGWFQGRLEFGPRALGNRSVLADPRNAKMKDKINKYLKKRDWFMPFAPSILSEAKGEYLEDPVEAPFMIMGFNSQQKKRKEIPAVVHVDGTLRPQTVSKETNPRLWRLIKEFENRTSVPVLLNTSFNRHGQPMVRSPEDAALHVVWGCVEYLIIHNYLVDANVKLEE